MKPLKQRYINTIADVTFRQYSSIHYKSEVSEKFKNLVLQHVERLNFQIKYQEINKV